MATEDTRLASIGPERVAAALDAIGDALDTIRFEMHAPAPFHQAAERFHKAWPHRDSVGHREEAVRMGDAPTFRGNPENTLEVDGATFERTSEPAKPPAEPPQSA